MSPERRAVRLEQQRAEGRVEELHAADRDRADRVAVVGVLEADERGPPHVLAAAVLPVLERHLQRDLDGGRARVRVEDAAEPGGRDLDQPRGELGGAGVGEAEHRRVGDAVELVADRLVDQRVAVAVDVAPQRRDAVEIAAPVGVDQLVPSAASIISGSSRDPVALLRERVPEVVVIELGLRSHPLRANIDRAPAGIRVDSDVRSK